MDLRKEGGNADRRDRQKLLSLEKAEPARNKRLAVYILALLTLEMRWQFDKLQGKKLELKLSERLPDEGPG